jgi:hypothetical protein
MDGKKLTRLFLDALDEESVADQYADQRKIYEYLDWAVALFVRETGILHTTVTITTVADQQNYDLPPDYIRPYMKGRYFAKYYDGSNYSWPILTSYEKIYKSNYTDTKPWPGRFAIIEKSSKESLIQGTADVDGSASGGECTLNDASMDFTDTNKVYPRDIIHNTTDGSDGYVLEVTDANNLKVALFGGTNNEWKAGDSYVIQPASEYELILDAPAESSGHTLTLPYICMPSPVFSDYGFWRINPRSCRAIAWGAAAIFKKPEREFTESAHIGGMFAAEVSRIKMEIAQAKLLDSSRYREVR